MLSKLFESLERRALLHGGAFDLHVNFQPGGSVVPSGYLADAGLVYGDRGNGFSYGWDAANTLSTRERNVLADQRYDTFTHTQAYGVRTWEAAVPNGQYTVHVVAGEPSYYNSVYKYNVEGVLTVNGTPTSASRFIEGTQTVTVSDGRLTISNADGSNNNKIAFLEIDSVDVPLSTVSVAATDPTASEAGDTGLFTFTRTSEDTAESLDVHFAIGGSATNGLDYAQILNTLTIPAGLTSVTLKITPIDDTAVEPTEAVTLTLLPDPTYLLGTANTAATVNITDNDVTAGFSTHINFQPAASATFAGYLVDSGQVYGARGNGLSYGWSGDNTTQSRDRNAALSPDQRYDTLVQFNGKKWELAVPNGIYLVHIVAGDPSYFDSGYGIDGEGVNVVSGIPSTNNRWIQGSSVVSVTDGRLTLTGASGSFNNKIDFIDVTPYAGQGTYVSVAAPADNASETGPTPRSFVVTRAGGDLSKSITLSYLVGGSATNGVDYAAISGAIIIPGGVNSINVTVTPVDDAIAESTETVTLSLFATSEYAVGNTSSATIRINDNDTPVGNTISYATKAANPIIRAEALRAVVDGKLYVFGGFSGDLGPVKRSDVYDPVANTWTQLPDLPTRVTHAGIIADGHDIYVAGGYVGIGDTGYSQTFGVTQTWKFNTDTKQWTSFVPLPKAVAGGGLVLLGRELHWVGGNNNLRQDIGDHYILNLDNLAGGWKTSTPLPNGRSHLGLVVLSGKLYATGGQFGNDDGLTTQKYLDVWDPANPSVWTRLADMPIAISHIASATIVFGNRLVTMGGETAHGVATDLVYAYDPASNTWAAMTKLPAPRFSGVAAAIDNFIYFTTGSSTTTTWKGTVS